ncbi:MAG: PhnA domain-containing protein [Bacteriovoracaceae bacterium]|jgi:protein PhnA|nr:PhnA domain-containing protein [Bacteriovoracaceae bacterium]
MDFVEDLKHRSDNQCELCGSTDELKSFCIKAIDTDDIADYALACSTCLDYESTNDLNHFRSLAQAIWSQHSSVKILCYKILSTLSAESWANDLLSQIYLTTEEQDIVDSTAEVKIVDSNGTKLNAGDTITLVKDLDVKGAGFTAKRGTVVKNIRLTDDPKYIEGKINGSMIVIVANFTKKA